MPPTTKPSGWSVGLIPQPLWSPPNKPTEVRATVPPMATLMLGFLWLFQRSKPITHLDNGHGNSIKERNQLDKPLPGGTGSDCLLRNSSWGWRCVLLVGALVTRPLST